ncbi:MAG: hypothetical protein WCF90_03930 [Methanomicrobiales archaeon]
MHDLNVTDWHKYAILASALAFKKMSGSSLWLFLLSFGPFDKIIGLLQAKDDGTARAQVPFYLNDAVRAFAGHTEEQFIARLYPLGVLRAGFTDTLRLVYFNYLGVLIYQHTFFCCTVCRSRLFLSVKKIN